MFSAGSRLFVGGTDLPRQPRTIRFSSVLVRHHANTSRRSFRSENAKAVSLERFTIGLRTAGPVGISISCRLGWVLTQHRPSLARAGSRPSRRLATPRPARRKRDPLCPTLRHPFETIGPVAVRRHRIHGQFGAFSTGVTGASQWSIVGCLDPARSRLGLQVACVNRLRVNWLRLAKPRRGACA
jgi:hypothetical protein